MVGRAPPPWCERVGVAVSVRSLRNACLWSVLACACGDDPAPAPPALQIGGGEVYFEPLMAGQMQQLYAGTQGGYHLWLSFRAPLEPGLVTMELDMFPQVPSRSTHSYLDIYFAEVPDEPGLAEYVGWPAQLLDPECAVDKPVHIHARFTDQAGTEVEAELELIPTDPITGFSSPCEP